MKHLMITLLGCCGLLYATAQDVQSFTLDEAVNYALENNLSIKNSRINISDAGEQIIERRSIGLPQLSAGANYQYFVQLPNSLVPAQFFDPAAPEGDFAEIQFGTRNNLTVSAELSMLLFDASYLTGLKAAKAYRQYAQYELIQQQYEVKNQVIEAYLPALILVESKKTLEKNISNLEKLYNETQALYREGFVEQLDVDRLELSLANLRTEVENIDRQRELILNVLKFQMGFPLEDDITVADDIDALFTPASQDALTAPISYLKRPEYQVLEMGRQLNELNIQFNKSGYLPNLAAFGSYQQSAQGNNLFDNPFWIPTAVVGLQLNVPIFDGFEKRAKINRAKLELDILNNQQRELERGISLEVANARTSYLSALERFQSQERNLALANRIYETTKIKYREGVGSSLEITQAEQSLYETQQNQVQARYDLLVAKMALDKALGYQ